MINSEYQAAEDMIEVPHKRTIRVGSMPLWRKSEIAWGIVRGAVRYRLAGPGRLPIIHKGVRLRRGNGVVRVGHLSEIHERVVLSAIGEHDGRQATVSIGDYTSIWYGTVVSARHEITIGRNCAISWNCTIIDNDMHEIIYTGDPAPVGFDPAVRIKDHVWIGASAIVLKGVTIGENSVVAAGAIVTSDVPSNTLVAGAPAKAIRSIAGWR
jgi:acetyltransferase-like isoleucine patch superfamily enzyme